MAYTCLDCGYESKMPIHGVDVIIEENEYWCAKCADIIFKTPLKEH